MFKRVHQAHQLWQHFGADWLMYRASYAARRRLGIIRKKLPATNWEAQPLGNFFHDAALADPDRYLDYRRNRAPEFFFNPSLHESYQKYFAVWDGAATVTPLDLSHNL